MARPYGNLQVIDISDSDNPGLVAWYKREGGGVKIGLAQVSDNRNGLRIVRLEPSPEVAVLPLN